MALRYWGDEETGPERFASLLTPDGTGIRTLRAATADLGWTALALSGDVATVDGQLRRGRPLIALLQVGRDRYHYVTVVGRVGGRIVFHDPAVSPYRSLPEEEFLEAWVRRPLLGDARAPGPRGAEGGRRGRRPSRKPDRRVGRRARRVRVAGPVRDGRRPRHPSRPSRRVGGGGGGPQRRHPKLPGRAASAPRALSAAPPARPSRRGRPAGARRSGSRPPGSRSGAPVSEPAPSPGPARARCGPGRAPDPPGTSRLEVTTS